MDSYYYRSTSNTVNLILNFLENNGYVRDKIISELELYPHTYNSLKFYSLSQISMLWQYAYDKFGTTVGLKIADYFKPSHWSDIGILLLSSQNLDEFFKRICKFVPLISTVIDLKYFTYSASEKKFVINFFEPVILEAERIETCLLCGWKLANLLHDNGSSYLRLEHIRSKPDNPSPWEAVFGSNIIWDAKETAIYISNEEAYRQTLHTNLKISAMLENDLSSRLTQQNVFLFSHIVKREILLLIKSALPTLKQVSDRLNMSSRSLQRHLEEEGITFAKLMNNTQLELSKEYLQQSKYSLFEIALMTGFSNSSNFSNAFKRWTNITPGNYREQFKKKTN
ncbi:DNA-binding transcriptional activator [Acinetobacter calcoaceticus]|uniref:AraC family transcriptional regulator n=1 Tax=Acinetobacter calcoaceticus TaxID=471 RepID=UPI000582EEC9|nr:AraC family transcriptional regulator [Acinetobacter calcoaceticus]GAM30562.1 DNA-binding transcriptional activator [Acinetobacter calcoaceticus]